MNDPTTPNRVTPKETFKPQRARLTGFTVMLDACVLVSATLRDVLLWSAELALFRPAWSADIIQEVRDTLVNKFGVRDERAEYMIGRMREAFPEAEVQGYSGLIPAMTNDPGDRHVLSAAIIGNAQIIVTQNIRDFPNESCAQYCIEPMTPDDFLCDLLDLDPDRMIEVLGTIASRRKMPPKTLEDLLEAVRRSNCPAFADAVRERLASVYSSTS
jgi:predicted nucleic acid-binding protein